MDRPLALVKGAFELRAMCLAGYEPVLDACAVCGCQPEEPRFHLREGVLHCARCRGEVGDGVSMPLDQGALAAMRHVAYGDPKRLFFFQLEEKSLSAFADVASLSAYPAGAGLQYPGLLQIAAVELNRAVGTLVPTALLLRP